MSTLTQGGSMPQIVSTGSDMGMSNSPWWILLLLLFGRGYGYGGLGGQGAAVASVDNTTWTASNFNRLEMGQTAIQGALRGVSDGICSSTFALNNSIKDGFAGVNTAFSTSTFALSNAIKDGFNAQSNAICTLGYEQARAIDGVSRQISDCCCTTNNNITALRGDVNNSTTAIIAAIHNTAKDAELREAYSKISSQDTALSEQRIISTVLQNLQPPRPVPAYEVSNPYTGQRNCY